MKQLVEFFEAILVAAGSYPATIAYVLFSPRKLVGEDSQTMICPPGFAIAISVFFFWFSKRLADGLLFPGISDQFSFVSFSTFAITLTAVAISVVLLRFTVRQLFGLRTDSKNPIDELRLLSYPASVGLVTSAATTVLAINFPYAAFTLLGKLDTDVVQVLATEATNIQVHSAVTGVGGLVAAVFSVWSLFNVIRTTYQASLWRSLSAAIAGLIVVGTFVTLVMISIVHTQGALMAFHQETGLDE